MKTVSQAYETQMKKPMRNPGRVSVTIDLTSEEAREKGYYTDLRAAHPITSAYSTTTNLFHKTRPVYTFAEFRSNIFKADGSLRFADPSLTEQTLDAGLIMNDDWTLAGGAQFAAEFSSPVRLKGFTIGFARMSGFYAFTITLKDSGGTTLQTLSGGKTFDANTTVFEWSDGFVEWIEGVSRAEFKFDYTATAAEPRIKYIMFGKEEEIEEYKILSVSINRHESPILEELPQSDVEVEIINLNNEFTYDYPTSMVYSLDTRQPLIIKMGYTLDDNTVEWVDAGRFSIDSWTVSRSKLTITATDIFRTMDEVYYGGSFKRNTVGDAISELCASIGLMTDVEYGGSLQFNNPIPPLPIGECLQLLCGMGMFRLHQSDTADLIKVSQSALSGYADFTLEDIDILDEAATIKNPQVKDIIVYYTSYALSDEEESMEIQGVNLAAGELLHVTWDEPARVYGSDKILVNGRLIHTTARNWLGAYSIDLAFPAHTLTDATVTIKKRPYIATKGFVRKSINPSGITIEWDNPLASNARQANRIATVLERYYRYGVLTYDVPYRGNPEIECGDHIYYTTETGIHPPMIVEDNDLQFNGAFRGHISGRKAVT